MVSDADETRRPRRKANLVEGGGGYYWSKVVAVLAMKHLIAFDPTVTSGYPDMSLWIWSPRLNNVALQCYNSFDNGSIRFVGSTDNKR